MSPAPLPDKAACPPDCPQCHGAGFIMWPTQGMWVRLRCQAYGRNGGVKGLSILDHAEETTCSFSKPNRTQSRKR
jgi:hypothetical protein